MKSQGPLSVALLSADALPGGTPLAVLILSGNQCGVTGKAQTCPVCPDSWGHYGRATAMVPGQGGRTLGF